MKFVNNTDSVLIFINTSYEDMQKLNPSGSFFTEDVPLIIASEYGLILLQKAAAKCSTVLVNDYYGALELSHLSDNTIEIYINQEYQDGVGRLKEKYKKARKKAKRFKRKYLELKSILENSIKSK